MIIYSLRIKMGNSRVVTFLSGSGVRYVYLKNGGIT